MSYHVGSETCWAVPGNWVDDAACRGDGGSMLVPTQMGRRGRVVHAHIAAAKVRCAGCPVRAQCRAWALTEPDPALGMMAGGLTPSERARVRAGVAP